MDKVVRRQERVESGTNREAKEESNPISVGIVPEKLFICVCLRMKS